jgi:hypothetical protein
MVDWAALLERLEFWNGYEGELTTLGMYAVGIALYGLLVFSLLSTVSKRSPFSSPDPRPGIGWAVLRGLRWLFLFPLFGFVYFLMIAVSLFFLAKGQTVGQILLVSVSIVAGIRISSWFSEPVAKEIAKLLPIGLLGVVIVEPGYAEIGTTLDRFRELPDQIPVLWRYLAALFLVELAAKPVLALWRAKEAWDEDDAPKTRSVPVKAKSKVSVVEPSAPFMKDAKRP